MAKAKTTKTSADEKFTDTDFPLFPALDALDRKDYDYYDRLTDEQRKKFVPFMLAHWMSAVKASSGIQQYYLQSLEKHANTYLLNEAIAKHSKLQWLMLCAASPKLGKQFHQYIPHIRAAVSLLKDKATVKEVSDYYAKIYTKESAENIKAVSEEVVKQQRRKFYLGTMFPNLKLADIGVLNDIITDEEIEQYEQDRGN
jgi:hypothetical protein